jgi:adenine phosphoribosyltransferase
MELSECAIHTTARPRISLRSIRATLANVLAACFIMDLPDLGGAEKIRKLGVPVRTLVSFEGH